MKRVRVAIVAALAVAVPGPGVADAAGPGDALSFRASVTPRTHLFGDPVTADVQAVAPTEAAAGMTIKTDFAPYVIVGPVEVTRPGETQRRVVFGPAKITVPVDGKSELATATWPIVIVRSRLGPEDRARPEQRASIYPVGDPTQRIGAATLERILWVAAIVVAVAAFALMLPFVRRIPRPRRGFERLGSAQRALVLARRAASRDDPSRRRTALERLGRELGRSGSPELAEEAPRLAWAESPPASDAMTGLVGRAEHELGGRR